MFMADTQTAAERASCASVCGGGEQGGRGGGGGRGRSAGGGAGGGGGGAVRGGRWRWRWAGVVAGGRAASVA